MPIYFGSTDKNKLFKNPVTGKYEGFIPFGCGGKKSCVSINRPKKKTGQKKYKKLYKHDLMLNPRSFIITLITINGIIKYPSYRVKHAIPIRIVENNLFCLIPRRRYLSINAKPENMNKKNSDSWYGTVENIKNELLKEQKSADRKAVERSNKLDEKKYTAKTAPVDKKLMTILRKNELSDILLIKIKKIWNDGNQCATNILSRFASLVYASLQKIIGLL